MNVEFDLAVDPGAGDPPDEAMLRAAAIAALAEAGVAGDGVVQLSVRIVAAAESADLNARYRSRNTPTNVLSFPAGADMPGLRVLGDLAVCAAVVEREAREQGKTAAAHWTHMIVHGVLHLLGFDHIADDEAEQMEALERRVMAQLGHNDPYLACQENAG